MDKQYFLTLFEYHHWAWGRILDTASELTDDEYTRPFGFGNVRSALVHALFAETLWLARCTHLPVRPLSESDLPTLKDLRMREREHREQFGIFLTQLPGGNFGTVHYRTARGENFDHPIELVLAQIVNHTTQHRSEAATALTELGHSPGDLDLVLYLRGSSTGTAR